MENPIYDLVIGNVPGAQDVSISPPVEQTTQAVQTESQEKATSHLTPLLTRVAQGCRLAQLVKCLVTSGYPDGSSSGGPGSNPGENENF